MGSFPHKFSTGRANRSSLNPSCFCSLWTIVTILMESFLKGNGFWIEGWTSWILRWEIQKGIQVAVLGKMCYTEGRMCRIECWRGFVSTLPRANYENLYIGKTAASADLEEEGSIVWLKHMKVKRKRYGTLVDFYLSIRFVVYSHISFLSPFCMIYRELFTNCLIMLQEILDIIIIVFLLLLGVGWVLKTNTCLRDTKSQ